MFLKESDLNVISELIGASKKTHIKFVDSFVSKELAIFMPTAGLTKHPMSKEHKHPSYMFVLSFNDQISFVLDNKEVKSKANKLFAISPGIIHREVYNDYSPRYIVIFIEADFFDSQLDLYENESEIIFNGELIDLPPNILNIIKEFMVEVDSGISGIAEITHSLNIQISHSIIRSYLGYKRNYSQVSNRLEINNTIEYMHSNIDKKINLEELSNHVSMSVTHFSRVFKREMGETAMNYLSNIRLDKAKKLLLSQELSITEIAYECGYSSLSHLSAAFKNKYNYSPKEYRDKTISS